MRKSLLLLAALLLLPSIASAQWQFESVFPTDTTRQFNSPHGIAVDPEGKIWVQYFGATDSVQVAELDNSYQPVRVLYVFNPDGTEADISPIKFLDFPGGERDTLGGFLRRDDAGTLVWEGRSGRGLDVDHEGNILVSQFRTLYRIDYQTGEGLDKAEPEMIDQRGFTAPAADENGNTYVTGVFPGDPLIVLDEDLNFVENAIDVTVGFSRSFAVSPDGSTIYWGGYTNNAVIAYQRPDPFAPFDSVGVVIPGMDSESFGWNPATGDLWVAAGSPNDPPNDFPGFETNWRAQTWYAFDPATLEVNTIPTPKDSLTWQIGDGASESADGRPRGIAFSPDGNTAYVIQFNQTAPSVEVFVAGGSTAIETLDSTIPKTIALDQNFPNPFNPTTSIRFAVTKAGMVSLKVHDVLGREVAVLVNETVAPGSYSVTLDGANLTSGTYLYTLEANGERLSRAMLLVK